MKSFTVHSQYKASITIDTELYSKAVVAKVLYWLQETFVTKTHLSGQLQIVELTSKQNSPNWSAIESELSKMFTDYALREIIECETLNIRTILYVKAFSHIDDYQEYD